MYLDKLDIIQIYISDIWEYIFKTDHNSAIEIILRYIIVASV